MVAFSDYFSVSAVNSYHRAVTMEEFMSELAPDIWPPNKRTAFCWGPRKALEGDSVGCNAKDGNPFGPFWDHSNVDFVSSQYFSETIGHDALQPYSKSRWDKVFYLVWSQSIQEQASEFIKTELPDGPFIGIHLRNDLDWDNVCKHVGEGKSHLFASPQCLGYRFEHGTVTMDLCQPSKESIVKQVGRAVKKHGAKAVYVAADRDHMISAFNKVLKPLGVKVYRRDPDEPHVSLAILARADYYIGNCVSSFSAFAKRERDANGRGSGFWNGPSGSGSETEKRKPKQPQEHHKHSEF